MKKQFRVAVVVFEEGNEELVFREFPEVIARASGPCENADDVEFVADEVMRHIEERIALARVDDEDDSDALREQAAF